jgi:hypothetical protein
MHSNRWFGIALIALAPAALSLSLATSTPQTDPKQAKQQFAAMMEKLSAPTESHKLIEPLVGTFDQLTEVKMGPGDPMRSKSVETGTWTMGKRFVRVDSVSAPEEELKGERMNVYGYDPAAKKFTLWGIESFGLTSYSATGDYDGATKTFTFDGERDAPGGGRSPFRWTMKIGDGGTITQTISVKMTGSDTMAPVVTVTHTRRKS